MKTIYKEHGVVMLATDDSSMLRRNTYKFTEKHGNPLEYGRVRNAKERGYEYQHLYITSDEEIKEGDWCYHPTFGKGIAKIVRSELCYYAGPRHKGDGSFTSPLRNLIDELSKIIATIDPKIGITDHRVSPVPNFCAFPQIPKSFIESYVKNPVDKVEVEYEVEYEVWDANTLLAKEERLKLTNKEERLKLTNNEISIKPTVEPTYTRADMLHALTYGHIQAKIGLSHHRVLIDYKRDHLKE